LAERTGARLAWVPRRAGERGALDAGALAGLLPGGRPVADTEARRQVATVWNVPDLPVQPGRDTAGILADTGSFGALLVGAVDVDDLPDPAAALAAIGAANFVVSLELRHTAITELADVVLPIAPVAEKAGTFVNWEGRERPFPTALRDTGAMPDQRVLNALAEEMGVPLELPDLAAARRELARLDGWDGAAPATPDLPPAPPAAPGPGEAILAGWRMLLDAGSLQDGEPHLAGTARPPVARLSPATAAEIGARDGDSVTVHTARGSVTAPLAIAEMPDRVVWLPLNSPGCAVYRQLGVPPDGVVRIERGPRGRGEDEQ
jgi:NADH-quinone oxidoreductase subunit G